MRNYTFSQQKKKKKEKEKEKRKKKKNYTNNCFFKMQQKVNANNSPS